MRLKTHANPDLGCGFHPALFARIQGPADEAGFYPALMVVDSSPDYVPGLHAGPRPVQFVHVRPCDCDRCASAHPWGSWPIIPYVAFYFVIRPDAPDVSGSGKTT